MIFCFFKTDCTDGSDEDNCQNKTTYIPYVNSTYYRPACSHKEFKCKDDDCIDWDRVCDEKEDCKDGSDENGTCETSCRDGPCEQKCQKSPNGPVCSCHDGYELHSDKTSCQDINECKNGDLPCAQKCDNTIGSYHCSCFAGFALDKDKSSCKSVDDKMFLFYSSYDTIYRLRPHLQKLPFTNNGKILGLDMNFDKQLLYFTVEDRDVLYELNWNNTNELNYVKNIGSPTQLAVDWITENVYFIDKAGTAIKVCHMSDKKCITLIAFNDGEHIKSITVDPLNHRLFYSILKKFDFKAPESKIFIHNLDGTNKQMIVSESFFVPAITCDFYQERLFYVGLDTKTIWSVNYDGTDKHLIVAKSEYITRPIQISLFESHVYVLNSGTNIVAKCPLYGDKQCKSLTLNVNQPDNLIIAQKSRQKSMENSCDQMKCNTICTQSDRGAKCICDYGEFVEQDKVCSNALVKIYAFFIAFFLLLFVRLLR